MLNVVLLAAFGINIDRQTSPFAPSRDIFDILSKTIETINKSPLAKVRECMCVVPPHADVFIFYMYVYICIHRLSLRISNWIRLDQV